MKRFSGKRGKCPAREALSSHVDGELDPAQAEALAKHLAGCDECARTVGELAWLKSHVSSLAAVSEEEPDYDRMWVEIERRLRAGRPAQPLESSEASPALGSIRRTPLVGRPQRRWRLAAAAALVIVIGSVLLLLRPQIQEEDAVVGESDRPGFGETPMATTEDRSEFQPQWVARLDRWSADSRMFLIGTSLVCERAEGGEACEGFRLRAAQLADEGSELAELLSDHGAPFEDDIVREVVSALRYLAAQPSAVGLTDTALRPPSETAVEAIFDINILDMYRREAAYVVEDDDL